MNKTQLIASLGSNVLAAFAPKLVEDGEAARYSVVVVIQHGEGATLTRRKRLLYMVVLHDETDQEDAAWEATPFPVDDSDAERIKKALVGAVKGDLVSFQMIDTADAIGGRLVEVRSLVGDVVVTSKKLAILDGDGVVLKDVQD